MLTLAFKIIFKHFSNNITLSIKHFANSFNISLYALFVALLVPAVKESKELAILVVITAILNVVLQFFIGNWSLIVATLLGAIIGMYIVDDETILGDAYNSDDDDSSKSKEVQ